MGFSVSPLSSGGASSLLTGKTLWVDSVSGSDGTGIRGQLDKPFLTLAAAKGAAVSGDVIHVGPGAYTVTDSILKDGVNWYFEAGAVISATFAADNGILSDKNSVITCEINGRGRFVQTGPNYKCFWIKNASSTVRVICQSIDVTGVNTAAYLAEAGTSSLQCDLIRSTGATSAGVQWSGGQMDVDAYFIDGDSFGVWSVVNLPPTGNLFVRANTISSRNDSFDNIAVLSYGSATSAVAYIECQTLKGTGRATAKAFQTNGGSGSKLYIKAQTIYGFGEADAGALYVEAQKWESLENDGTDIYGSLFFVQYGGTSRIRVAHLSPVGTSAVAMLVTGGTCWLEVGDYVANATAGGLVVSGGTLRLKGYFNTSANTGVSPISISNGSTVVCQSGTILVSGSADGITSLDAENVVVMPGCSANVGANSNVIQLVSTLTVSADIA